MQNEKMPERGAALASLLNDASIDCMIALDKNLKVIVWNRMCESVSSISEKEIAGKKLEEIFPALKDCTAFNTALENALKGFKSFLPVEHCTFMAEYMESHVIPLKDEKKEIIGVMILLHDVAHRQKAETELKRLNGLLARKNRDLENRNMELVSFSKLSSHDLKGPLRKISIFANMVMEKEVENLSEEGKSLFQRIRKSAAKAEELNDDILRFTLIQKSQDEFSSVPLDTLLLITKHKLQHQIATTHAEINAPALPVISGYRELLQQLFDNILDNAIKFQPVHQKPIINILSGEATGHSLSHADALPEINYTWISFSDNGIGFDQAFQNRIFELFEKLHRTDEYPGNGIGLPICRKIMELHQGFMIAESNENSGSTFTCYFPASLKEATVNT